MGTFIAMMVFTTIKSKEVMVQDMRVLSDVVGRRSIEALVYYDPNVARENLKAFEAKSDVSIACLYDETGVLFANFIRENDLDTICPSDQPVGYRFNDRFLEFHRQIMMGNQQLGSLYVKVTLRSIHDHQWQYLIIALAAFFAGTLMAYIISARMLRVVTDPVDELVSKAQEVSEHHNYAVRAMKFTEDELGVLVDSFNNMLWQIESREKAVVSANEGLERRVKERTKALLNAKEEAERANRAKTGFLANMSHELRTPMHVILSYADFGLEEAEELNNEGIHKYFSRIKDSGSRLLHLLNNLLDLSKLDSGKVDLDIRENDMMDTIDRVYHETQNLFEEKSVTLNVVQPSFKALAEYDQNRIIQVVYNLFSNAVKFSNEGDEVSVLVKSTSLALPDSHYSVDAIEVSVRDTGIGVPADELTTIFDKFVQSRHTTTGAGGTGLGLAICAEIIKDHQGTIWCENNKDDGATFSFVIPLQHQTERAAPNE